MTKVLELTKEQLNRMKDFYRDDLKDNDNEHVYFAVKSCPIMAYNSGKVVFQGPKGLNEYNMWIEIFDMVDDIIKKDIIYYSPSIGSDEVGKGDYFGPLVVCACYVNKHAMDKVRDLRISDSKKRTDDRIRKLAKEIKDDVTYSLLVLSNEKYNDLVNKGFSVTKMMSILHNKAITNLVDKLNYKGDIYIDQFAEPGVYFNYVKQEPKVTRNVHFTTKAESKHSSVAVASILARYKYLLEMDRLSDEIGFTLPKGAGDIVDQTIAKIITEHGIEKLKTISKFSFANTEKAKKYLT